MSPLARAAAPLLLAFGVLGYGCGRLRVTLPVDAGITFAAHRAADGFVIDRTSAGATGRLEARGRLHQPDAPHLALVVGDAPPIGLWIVGRSRVFVRAGTSTLAPRAGEILSAWDEGAIRLTLYPASGPPLTTDTFRTRGPGPARSLARTDGDPSGSYRAVLRDGAGVEVGWLRVELGTTSDARVYDAVLPAAVDDGLAAAAVVALDAELGWIEDHRAAP